MVFSKRSALPCLLFLLTGASLTAQTTISCGSDNGRRNFCVIDTRGGVSLGRQRSSSPCRQNETWGYDRRGIWVDRGCRADFIVGRGPRPLPPQPPLPPRPGYPGYVVSCASNDGRRSFCNADTRRGVRLLRQRSDSPCRQGYSWGYNRSAIWVDRGCRADFQVGGR